MCHRIAPFSKEQLEAALAEYGRSGHPRLDPSLGAPAGDAYPKRKVALFYNSQKPGDTRPFDLSMLRVETLFWGFPPFDGTSKVFYNTRLDTALKSLRLGGGYWTDPMKEGRCLLPVQAFYEGKRGAETRFSSPRHSSFLLAAVKQKDHFSIVTVDANDSVRPYHHRMPLVLGPGDSARWMNGDFRPLKDRSSIVLSTSPAEPR